MILEFSMRGIQSLDHLNGCNKRIHRNRRHPTLNTPIVLSLPSSPTPVQRDHGIDS